MRSGEFQMATGGEFQMAIDSFTGIRRTEVVCSFNHVYISVSFTIYPTPCAESAKNLLKNLEPANVALRNPPGVMQSIKRTVARSAIQVGL